MAVKSRDERTRCVTKFEKPSLTRQSEAASCCIHNILGQYSKTGLIPQVTAQPLTGILPDVETFHDAMNIVAQSMQTFEALPSNIRQAFHNDPKQFLAFATNPENKNDMIKLGLANPAPEPEKPIQVQVINEPEILPVEKPPLENLPSE